MSGVLTGRTAIVTGASQGLGLAIAGSYVEAGARVLACAREEEALHRAEAALRSLASDAASVETVRADVSSPTDVQRMVAHGLECFSSIDILVNNAGIYGPKGLTEDVKLGRMGTDRTGESLWLRPLLPRRAASLASERVRQDHPALWRWGYVPASAP